MRADERGDAALTRYTRVAIWFHWVIAALVLFNLSSGLLHDYLPKGLPLIPWHKAVGISVLFLSVARLAWRLTHRPPPLPAMPRWQTGAAHGLHWLFYLLIILMPLSGWVFSSAALQRRLLTFFGLFDIPYLPLPQTPHGGDKAYMFHVYAGWIMAALVLVHIAAALRHHFLDRDRTLARMAPGMEPRASDR